MLNLIKSFQICRQSHCSNQYQTGSKVLMMATQIRPTLDDVERISRGEAARRRGTGSRGIPHRLNSLERSQWDLAKKKKFLVLRGTGWRKERGDSPLANIYRQFCDATAIPAISICQGLGVGEVLEDTVVIDFSPLRTLRLEEFIEICKLETQNEDYKNIKVVEDNTATTSLENIGQSMDEDVIWRVPVISLVVHFTDRAESKMFAEAIATKLTSKQ